MSSARGARLALWGVLVALLLAAPAWAQGLDPRSQQWQTEPTTADYLSDLESSDGPERLFAARELDRRLQSAARTAARTGRDSLSRDAARVELLDLRRDVVAPASRAVVAHRNVRARCAGLLQLAGDPRALGPLREALEAEPRRRVRQRITAAIQALEAP